MKKLIIAPLAFVLACNSNDEATKRFEQRQKELGAAATTNLDTAKSIKTCYTAQIGKDSAFFNIEEKNKAIEAQLNYKRFESDNSTGTFTGAWYGDTLRGNYHFMSEGTYSDVEKVFLRIDGNLVEAIGPLKEVNPTKLVFTDYSLLEFGKVYTFKSVDCAN